jgi:rfaE bifunctional protein nucleotidyltransferase chain/domain
MKNIWVNGCFDIVHLGHIRLLNYAKSLGDFLIVGIDSDSRVRKNKGTNRPIYNQDFRKEFLSSLKPVDQVEIFYTDEQLENLIQHHKINTMVVGDDYLPEQVIGSKFADKVNTFVKFSSFSTTNLLDKCRYLNR